MKKFFLILILILSFYSKTPVFAQLNSCSAVNIITTKDVYTQCCSNPNQLIKPRACYNLNIQDKCDLGVISGTQCGTSTNTAVAGKCTDINSQDDFMNCCASTNITTLNSNSSNNLNTNLCTAYQTNGASSQQYICASYEAKGQANTTSWISAGCQILSLKNAGTWQSTCATLSPTDSMYTQLNCLSTVTNTQTLCNQINVTDNPDQWLKLGCDGYITPGSTYSSAISTTPISGSIVNLTSGYIPSKTSVKTACSQLNLSHPDLTSLPNILLFARCYIGSIFPLLMTFGLLFFLWNIVQYVIRPNPLKNEERRNYIIWGLVGLFVMVSLWGLIYFVSNTFGLGAVIPQLPITK